jgi:hypothetical protein
MKMLKLKSLIIAGFLITLAAAKGFATEDLSVEEAPSAASKNPLQNP